MSIPGPSPAVLPARACPLCEARKGQPWLHKGALQLVRCGACSMVYADPVETELASGRFYDRLAVPFYLSADKLQSDYAPVRFERELRLFRRFCPGGRVLDVGCSTGAFLFQLTTRWPDDYTVLGLDVAGAALDHAESRGVPVLRRPFLQHDFGDTRFAAVTFWAMLEHVVEPGRFLRKAATLLLPGGLCMLLAPNLGSLAVRILGARYRYIMPDHVNYFSATTLRAFAAREPAFEVLALGSTHFNPIVIWQDIRGGVERVADAERARLLKRTTGWKQKPCLKPLKALYSVVERGLGRLRLADNLVLVLRKRAGAKTNEPEPGFSG